MTRRLVVTLTCALTLAAAGSARAADDCLAPHSWVAGSVDLCHGALVVISKGWDKIALFKTGDPGTNTIGGTMPLPPGDKWRVQAAVAQSDGTVMNVAFRGVDEQSGFKGNDPESNVDPDKGSWFE